MKIGIVCYPTYGGSGVVATELGKALALKGHEIHFISYSQPFRLDFFSENIFYHEVDISDYPLFDYKPYELALTGKLVDVVKYEKLDLLHVHYAIPHASAAYMAKQILASEGIHVPYITTLHGTDITLVGKDSSFGPVITFSINQSDAVTAVSANLKKDTYRLFPVTKEIDVVHNFIDLTHYEHITDPCFRPFYALDNEHIITHVSNFRKVKRVEDVVKVFAKVRESMPAKLLLVGDGPERNHIESLCRELGLWSDVRFLGKLKTVEKVLAVSDLFLLTSETESFGLSALEAMASKVPVISTNTGGLPEVNIDGVTGFTSNVGDIEDMAANALKILTDPITHSQFRENAYNKAKEFDINNILPQYEAVYARVLNRAVIAE
jgi:N-acetyl-alpha-D-glucosaminyl L-malate synthase BshA